MGREVAIYALAGALVVSLAAHVFRSVEEDAAGRRPRGATTAFVGDHAEPAASGASDVTCQRDLEACRAASRSVAFENIRHPVRKPGVARQGETESGPGAQARVLCTKAKRSLDEAWRKDRGSILTALERGLADPVEQERNERQVMANISEAAGLDEAERAALQQSYPALRRARVLEVQAALAASPQDLEEALEAARGLFEDEDELLLDIAGEDAVLDWRLNQLESRTVILALFSSLAEQPWDELEW